MPEGETKFLKGYLLLDSGQLQGSFFQRTVVLVCQHDEQGAFGLVLNRPSGSLVSDVLLSDMPEVAGNLPVHVGGPVQPTALSYLVRDNINGEGLVIPQVTLGHSLEVLSDLPPKSFTPSGLKLFAGYSGWSPGQLESEIQREAWVTHPATEELVFETDPANLWQTVLRLKGWRYRILAQMPDNPEWN